MTIVELERFQTDLRIVLASNAPLELDSEVLKLKSRGKRMAQLNRFRQVVQDCMVAESDLAASQKTNDGLPNQANASNQGSGASIETLAQGRSSEIHFAQQLNGLPEKALSRRYKAALQTFAVTGSLTPVLDGLTVRGFARQHLKRIIRWPLFYLSVLALMTSAGLYLYWIHVLPEIIAFRAQTPKSNLSTGWDFQTWLPTLLICFVVLAIFVLLLLLVGGFFRILMWMGGSRYLDLMSLATAQRIVPLLIDSGLTADQAVSLSYQLCGLKDSSLPRAAETKPSDDSQAWNLGSEYWLLIANLQLTKLRLLFPVLMMAVAGGLLLAVYGVSVYGPVVSMLRDLSFVGFES